MTSKSMLSELRRAEKEALSLSNRQFYKDCADEIERMRREVRTQYECIIEYGRETERLRAALLKIKVRIESVPINQRENDEIACLEFAEDALGPADETDAGTVDSPTVGEGDTRC